MSEQPQGKSRSDLLAIVRADHARLDRLAELWTCLWPYEQEELIATAQAMADKNDGDTVPEPQSIRA